MIAPSTAAPDTTIASASPRAFSTYCTARREYTVAVVVTQMTLCTAKIAM